MNVKAPIIIFFDNHSEVFDDIEKAGQSLDIPKTVLYQALLSGEVIITPNGQATVDYLYQGK